MPEVPVKDLKIPQGTTYELILKSASDLTGYTSRMQMRPTINSDTVLFEIPTNGTITITYDSEIGESEVRLLIPEATTAAWEFTTAVYDIELISPEPESIVSRPVKGSVTVDLEVTR